MRRFLVISIPIATIAIFILIMLSENYLKNPLTGDDNIQASIESVRKEIEKDDWAEAGIKTEQLSAAWDKVVKRVQFSAEKDEINGFYRSIARLRGAVSAKDKSNGLMELNEAYEYWENIGK